ncbi:MAG: hypothetical protein KAJ19_08945 [Gammaproteobacteria bacterium]|nr:hypothetical protein [Gammaproteobacteria bacterium]
MTVKGLEEILAKLMSDGHGNRVVYVRTQYRDGVVDMVAPLDGMDREGRDKRAPGNSIYLVGVCDE